MRLIFATISLLIALGVSGLLVKSQLAARFSTPIPVAGKVSNISTEPFQTERVQPTQHQQIQKIQDQVRQSLDTSAQRIHPSGDE